MKTKESHYRNLFKRAPYGILVFAVHFHEPDGDYSFELADLNSRAEQILSIDKQISNTLLLQEIIPSPLDADMHIAFVEALQTGQSITKTIYLSGEGEMLHADIVPASDAIFLYLNPLRSDESSRSNEEETKYRELFENSLDAIFLAGDNYNIISFNPRFQKSFGYEESQHDKLTLRLLFRNQNKYEEFVGLMNRNEFVEELEVELQHRDGTLLQCVLNCQPILDEQGQLLMYQGVIRDITHRKKAERQLLRAEKLTLTGKLARSIAHEVRNPLTNIQLALDQLKDELKENNVEATFYINLIDRNAQRVSGLISDLLNSSKQKQLDLQSHQLNDAVGETLSLIKDRIELKSMQMEVSLAPGLPTIFIDKDQVKIALLNVLLNAVEAMKENEGVLRIKTYRDAHEIVVEVCDNGKGIGEEEIDHLFEPFYTGSQDGTGLGLTTTHNIINAHRGRIDVSSKLNSGTTFSICFNINTEPEAINTQITL